MFLREFDTDKSVHCRKQRLQKLWVNLELVAI
jgi:hypothetical protein